MESQDKQVKLATQIIKSVCKEYSVTYEDLKSTSRKRRVTTPRHIAMHHLRRETSMRVVDIAELFNRRTHACVLHACDKVERGIILTH